VQAPASAPTCFSDLLAAAAAGERQLEGEGVLSLALPLPSCDPLALLSRMPAGEGFRFLWDSAPGLCLAASGRTHSLELSGPRRFELAQRFSAVSLGRLAAPQGCPPLARPRVLLAFGFFDSPLQDGEGVPGVQAVLPRWQLSRQGRHCWLRLQRSLGGVNVLQRSAWQEPYRQAAHQALALVDEGRLDKLVLAVRQQLDLSDAVDPLALLAPLRRSQAGSCRFLWQRQRGSALLGASPERLLSVRQGQLRSDALAGTASCGEGAALMASAKDRLEHELVVETILTGLGRAGLGPRRPRHPRLARHGQLVHLHTPITAALQGQDPLAIAAALHPTPAVAGLPRREAMGWLRSLEPFERGHYAAPIGWIDAAGDLELRVAIRSGTLQHRQLILTAGAGLVRDSEVDRELAEVQLKLGVLQQQLNLPAPAGLR
jgi:menaquinone-specific isochorismate synthase